MKELKDTEVGQVSGGMLSLTSPYSESTLLLRLPGWYDTAVQAVADGLCRMTGNC
jgi:hypothetical protein